jgi:hypothetical protein
MPSALLCHLRLLTDHIVAFVQDNKLHGSLDAQLAQLAHVDTAYFDGNPQLQCPLSAPVKRWLEQVKYAKDPCAA